MSDQNPQTQEQYAGFYDRMIQTHGHLLGPAMRVALALKEGREVPSEFRVQVDAKMEQYRKADTWPATQGDLMALCLSGMLRKPDSKVKDLLLQIESEKDGVQAIYRRNRGKKIEDWPREDAELLYKLECQKDVIVDPVDLGVNVAYGIFGTSTGNQVRAFAHLRRTAGITRSCFYKQGAAGEEKVKRDFIFLRRSQESVRTLLVLAGVTEGPEVAEAAETEVDDLLAALTEAAQRDRKRQIGGTDAWAARVLTAWLDGKQVHNEDEDAEKIEAIDAAKAKIKQIEDDLAVKRAKRNSVKDDRDLLAVVEPIIKGIEKDLEAAKAELAELQGGVSEAGVLESATPVGTGPMPGNTPTVVVQPTDSGIKLPETLAEVIEELANRTKEHELKITAADRHYQDAQRLYEEAETLRKNGNRKEAGKRDVKAAEHEELVAEIRSDAEKIQARITVLEQKLQELKPSVVEETATEVVEGGSTGTGETESTVTATNVAEGGETIQAGGSTELPTFKQLIEMIDTSDLGEADKKSLKKLALKDVAKAFADFTELTTPVEEEVVEAAEEKSELELFVDEVNATSFEQDQKDFLIEWAQENLTEARGALAEATQK